MTWTTLAATGHRAAAYRTPGLTPQQLTWARERCRAGLTWLATRGLEEVWSGFATGWDLTVAAVAFDVGIPLVAHIPYESQVLTTGWAAHDRGEWVRLRALAVREVIYGANPNDPDEKWQRMKARNAGLVQADALLALWDGRRRGGTWSTICMAQRLGRPGILLDPVARTTRMVEPGCWLNELGAPSL